MERFGHSRSAPWRDRARDWFAGRAGLLQYLLGHHRRDAWGGPFNGQEFRQRLFADMAKRIAFVAIVETGTHRGMTTEFFRRASNCPIHSFETNPRHYAFAAAKLKTLPDLHLHRCDSRAGLVDLATSNSLPPGCVFFYLDAHWSGELPLADEIALALRHWPEAVVMVDDFAVPDDPGYTFDDFGPGKTLNLEYLADNKIRPPGVWFPHCPSSAETGARRGCVILARDTDVARQLDTMTTLRRWRKTETETETETGTGTGAENDRGSV